MTNIVDTARLNRAKLMMDIETLDWFIAFSEDLMLRVDEHRDQARDEQARPGPESTDGFERPNSNVVWLKDAAQARG